MLKRRMRFEAMEDNNTTNNLSKPSIYILKDKDDFFSIEATIEEKEALDDFIRRKAKETEEIESKKEEIVIQRLSLDTVNKFLEPFKNYAEGFIEAQKGRGNAVDTIKHYEQTIRKLEKFFGWLFCERKGYDYTEIPQRTLIMIGMYMPFGILEDISLEAKFREFLTEIEEVKLTTVETYFRDYRAISYWGMDLGFIKKHAIVIKKEYGDIKECYTDDEIEKLLKEPKKDSDFSAYRSWVAIHWLLATGNRVGTLVNVKITDVDFTDNLININTQKNKKVMRLPMIPQLRKVLKRYIDEWLVDESGHYLTTFLFPSSYESSSSIPMTRQNMSRSIAKFNKSRGVYKTSVHLFRHTFVRKWLLDGGDIHALQRILGHSSLDMVVHYANIIGADLRPQMEDYSILATHKAKPRGKMIKKRKGK